MRRDGHPRITLIQRLLSEPRRLIVTILIGNELVNVAASVISAAFVIQFMGAENKWINLFIMVPILLLVGEITPKTMAIRNNVAFAGVESHFIELFARLITPLRWLVRNVADWFITLIVGKERSRGNIITEDMVRTLAHEAVGEGALDKQEAQFIDHIFDFGNKTLEDVMTPRSDISFLPLETPLPEVIEQLRETRQTKLPVYREHRDDIVGILHARDLLGADMEALSSEPKPLEKLVREGYFVPESKPAAELFHSFRDHKRSFALTVDEYGGITGLVTMEDLLECIFGDIRSPSDLAPEVYMETLDDGRHIIDGTMPIADFNRETASKCSHDQAQTIGGLLLMKYGELPAVDTSIVIDDGRFTVAEVGKNRIQKILWQRITATDSTPDAAEPNAKEDK